MKSPSSKYFTGFIFRFILGTLIVLGLISATRVLLTNRMINKSTNLINNGDAESAIEQLQSAKLWSPAYPSQARRIDYLMGNACLMQKDRATARQYANSISTHTLRKLSDTPSLWEKSLVYPDQLINIILKEYGPEGWDITKEQAEDLLNNSSYAAPRKYASTRPRKSSHDNTNPSTSRPMGGTAPLPNMPDMPDIPDMPSMQDAAPDIPSSTSISVTPNTREWGLTADHETAIYSMKGKLRGHIPAGNIIEVHSRKSSPKGDLLICTVTMNGKKHPKTVIRLEDTIIYNCALSDTTAEQRNLAIQHARLLGQVSQRETQLKKEMANKNPYAAKYKTALAEYKKVAEKSNALLKEYNNSSGPRRMELADKLRLIKHDSGESKKNYTEIKNQYKSWKTENPSAALDIEGDSQIRNLRQKLAVIEKQLSNP